MVLTLRPSLYDAGGMNRGSTRDNRDEPGQPVLHRESIKMFNTFGTGNNRDGTGNNRDGTEAPTGPIQTPAELRQRPGGAPANADRDPV
ncbi:hypothetical protein DPMN_130612 [Dreissena polymorpha]|uniref:Uncharacterized protein n=1 Tax=Dreissena polymorpha TaxID=45954 RepID=A0A9D4H6Z7_DREPO|nr:hypothetical protein DPMN_130612 [Dreissena polymorpha]